MSTASVPPGVTGPGRTSAEYDAAIWRWRKVRALVDAQEAQERPRKARGFLRLPRADRAVKVTLRVVYKGGAESYWLVEARGEHQVFAGHLCLEDVMARVLSER